MTVPNQSYKPVGTLAVDMAVATTLSAGAVTEVTIHLRSRAVIATPATFITDNGLEHEVISRAGLDEDSTLSAFVAASSTTEGVDYVYVLTAAVGS